MHFHDEWFFVMFSIFLCINIFDFSASSGDSCVHLAVFTFGAPVEQFHSRLVVFPSDIKYMNHIDCKSVNLNKLRRPH